MGGECVAWDSRDMSRAARIALVSAVVFAVSAVGSGLLIDEYGGAAGVLEWVLRTLVIVSGAVAIGAGFVLISRLRRAVGPRPLAWALTVIATAAFAFFVVQPAVFAVYLSHLPTRRAVHDADLGAPKQAVTLTTAKGVHLRGWYVPSRNGAAVTVLHGTGSNRLGVADHARLLARHGYGVLIFDLEGNGQSEGRSTSLPSHLQPDADAALAYLRARPDVHGGRIGIVGVSLGGEVAIDAVARHREWRAAVLEGVQGASPADMTASRPDPVTYATFSALYGLGRVLGGAGPSASNPQLVERIAPRPLLLLSSGHGTEARANQDYQRRGGRTTALWNLPDASHAAALRTAPKEYERRVVGFLDRALR
jgi:pimeloyl-ACP methyl ester carboxylesterase